MKRFKKFELGRAVIAFLVWSGLPMNASSVPAQVSYEMNIVEVLKRMDPDQLSVELVEAALPRRTDESLLLQLRSGNPAVLRGPELADESEFKTCMIIGAYFTAALWDWNQFVLSKRNQTEMSQLKYVMDGYLHEVNHRLKKIRATQKLLNEIDDLKRHFSASEDELSSRQIRQINKSLGSISKGLYAFMLNESGYQRSFAFGE